MKNIHEKKFIVSVFLLIFLGACGSPFGTTTDLKNISSPNFCPFSTRLPDGSCPTSDSGPSPVETRFVSKWQTTSDGETITLPLLAAGTYDFTVDWGDDSQDTITAFDQAEVTHTYSSADTYTVIIDGTIHEFSFNNGGDRAKIVEISNWGVLSLGDNVANVNGSMHFRGAFNLIITAEDLPDLSSTTSLKKTFQSTSLTSIPNLANWDISNVTNLASIFEAAPNFNQDISAWDVSNVTDMNSAFSGATSFNQDISGWDTSNVTNMRSMFAGPIFAGGTNFDQNLGNWDISQVTTMQLMFGADGFPFNGTTLSPENYKATLKGWSEQTVTASVNFGGGSSVCDGDGDCEAYRLILGTDNAWNIMDGDGSF